MIPDGKFQILGIKTTMGHYIIIFSRNSSCLPREDRYLLRMMRANGIFQVSG